MSGLSDQHFLISSSSYAGPVAVLHCHVLNMAILSKTEVALHSFGLGSQDRGVVQDCLKDFRALSPEQQEKARPVTIETLFQLVLGGNASIQKSSGFKKLKIKPW